MTREEIEKAQVIKLSYFETPMERIWYNIGCKDGLKAADAEPSLESLWHDASEEPQENEYVLIQDEENDYDVVMMQSADEWNTWCGTCKIIRWTYISDLLPKHVK